MSDKPASKRPSGKDGPSQGLQFGYTPGYPVPRPEPAVLAYLRRLIRGKDEPADPPPAVAPEAPRFSRGAMRPADLSVAEAAPPLAEQRCAPSHPDRLEPETVKAATSEVDVEHVELRKSPAFVDRARAVAWLAGRIAATTGQGLMSSASMSLDGARRRLQAAKCDVSAQGSALGRWTSDTTSSLQSALSTRSRALAAGIRRSRQRMSAQAQDVVVWWGREAGTVWTSARPRLAVQERDLLHQVTEVRPPRISISPLNLDGLQSATGAMGRLRATLASAPARGALSPALMVACVAVVAGVVIASGGIPRLTSLKPGLPASASQAKASAARIDLANRPRHATPIDLRQEPGLIAATPATDAAQIQRASAVVTPTAAPRRPKPVQRSKSPLACQYAVTYAERMVCRDPRLTRADREMKRAYSRAIAAGVPPELLEAEHRDWLEIREEAARESRREVAALYAERTDHINFIADPPH